ncbi:hypothetical protein [Candidatus Nitrotoga arctica]|uniref:Uncharacterized protein n=1 Tax=Candidatus Nitrotoga arctica TaxID=453162 RepID=A0ABM8YVP4_9PROT|nr:hypothetical protein [Candidatus Nitrotoga arctica]CAG9931532.1 conserved protein of unknown function [Candidatus Nitrotoga arctica]
MSPAVVGKALIAEDVTAVSTLSYSGLGTIVAEMVTGNKTWLITACLFLISVIMLTAPVLAATPAQEKAFVDGFKKAVERKDAKALKALLYTRDADPTVLEFFNMMIVADFGSTIKSIKLVDLTAEENKQMELGGKNIQGKPMKMPLKPIKSLLITTGSKSADLTTNGTSQWYVAEYEGKLVIPVPALVK